MAIPVLSAWCADCQLVEIPTNDVFKALAVQYFCSGGGGGGGSGIVVTENCLLVTDDGAWGSIGQIIDEYVFFNTAVDPPVETARLWYNRALASYVTGIDIGNSEACPDELFGTDCDTPLHVRECNQPSAEGSLTSSSSSGSSSVAAGAWSVSIANTGGAAGTVDGQTLPQGQTISFTGHTTVEETSGWRTIYLPEIAYNATGTTFIIRVIS